VAHNGSNLDGGSPPTTPLPVEPNKSFLKRNLAAIVMLAGLMLVIIVGLIVAGVTRSGKNRGRYVQDDEAYYVEGFDSQDIRFTFTYSFELTGETSEVNFVTLVPKTIDRRQQVSVSFQPQPDEVFEVGENQYAKYIILDPPGDFDITITGNATLFRYDLQTAREMGKPPGEEDLAQYLEDEDYLEKDSLQVKKTIEDMDMEGKDNMEVVAELYDYVVETLDYYESSSKQGAASALSREAGACGEYSDVLVTLCRALGIPAKTAYGVVVVEPLHGDEFLECLHGWTEIYLQDYGWVPFDPVCGESGPDFFDKSYPVYLRFSDVRNDMEIWLSNYFNYYCEGDPAEVNWRCEFDIEDYSFEDQQIPSGEE
jgi:transglutaminase-like putative cysteine protease